MPQELPKNYKSSSTEKKWSYFWEQNQFFRADPNSTKPSYCIVIPPPNVTGILHMGHALVNTLQDVLIRWKRMSGFEALWIPGTDHAGIATQTVVERNLIKTTGKRRTDFSRDKFLEHVWKWKEENEHLIIEQLKRLGCSCDWQRQRFTMDTKSNLAVRTTFKKLFTEGLIYRGDYLVNWDPVTQTALADDEVEYEERQSSLWYFRYPIKDTSGYIEIATTRPETVLGDTAVAVSPNDSRYAPLIGKTVLLPIVNREIPIIADHRVDPEFGTGAVKITPAHDPNDYQIGLDHDLPFINIMTPNGQINENGEEFAGQSMSKAREGVVKKFKELGLLVKIEPHTHRIGVSYRSKATIEPYLSKQWFVKMEGFANKLRAAVENKKVKLIPEGWESVYFHWIDNLRDWCISRQLWWGHRIPIWYSASDPNEMICYDGEGIPPEAEANPEAWIQDEDVLDTWFSSALWPFSTLGWPENTKELKTFYPNSVLVTGYDILFFWVARMIAMGEHLMAEVPFPKVFLHGLIYGKSYWRNSSDGGILYVTAEERKDFDLGKPLPNDVHSKWEKMSKSKGNIIDPIDIIEEYGTDAMRMGLCASSPQAREIDLDRRRFEEFKNFANKLWNGARFIFMHLDGNLDDGLDPLTPKAFSKGFDLSLLNLEDYWILSILNHRIQTVTCHLDSYTFDQAAIEAYDFYWNEFCAYYLEIAKPILFGKLGTKKERENKQKILAIVLSNALRLLHPIAPFVTEELYEGLKSRLDSSTINSDADPYTRESARALQAKACIVAPYPTVISEKDMDPAIEETFSLIHEVLYCIRNIRGEMKIPPSQGIQIHLIGQDLKTLKENERILSALTRIESIQYHQTEPSLGFSSTGIVQGVKIIIPLPAEMLEKEKLRLEKEQQKLTEQVKRAENQLKNPNFLNRAPKELVTKHQNSLNELKSKLEEVESKISKI